jgi:hypothetical protein
MSIHQMMLTYAKNDSRIKDIRLIGISQDFNRKDFKEIENHIIDNLAGDIKYNFAFLKLTTGRLCIISVSPNCNGGYILHAITLDKGYFSFYPIEAYRSPLFRQQTEKNVEMKSKYISNLKHFPLSENLNFESMVAFVRKTSGYNVKKLISIFIESIKNKKTITLNGSEETIVYTVAAIQMAFPQKLAHSVFFSISSNDGKSFTLHIITGKGYMSSQETAGYASFVNMEENFINLELSNYRFSHIVELGYLIAKQNLEAFHTFLNYFCYESLDEKIEDAYNLFSIVKTGIGEMGIETIEAAVEYANRYGTSEAYRQILVQIPGVLDKISREINPQSGEILTIFLFKAANEINSIFFLDRIYDFFYKSIYNMIFGSNSDGIIKVKGFYNSILEQNCDKAEDFARYALNPKRVDALNHYLIVDRESEKSKFYLGLGVSSLIKLKYQWKKAYAMDGIKELIDICIENAALSNRSHKSILVIASEEEDYFVNIFIKIYEKLEYTENMVENLSSILKSKDDIWTLRVRKYIKAYDHGEDILFKEFLVGLEYAENLIEYFDDYYTKVFCEIQDYREKYLSKALKAYFERIPENYMFTACFKAIYAIIRDNLNLEKDLIALIIKDLECEINLSSPSDEIKSIVPAIKNLKKTRSIVTTPDITKLLDFGIWIDGIENSQDIIIDEIIKEGIDLDGIDMKRYGEYLNWCLPITITCCDSPEDHRAIIRIFNITDNEGDFFLAYMGIVEKLLDKENVNGYEVLLSFITYFFFYFEPKYKLQGDEELLGRVKSRIVEILLKQNKSWLQRFSSDIKNEFSSKGLSIPVQWDEIYNNIIEVKNKSLFKKIKEVFNKNMK